MTTQQTLSALILFFALVALTILIVGPDEGGPPSPWRGDL